MKKLFDIIDKLSINFFSIVLLVTSFILGKWSLLLTYYFVAIVHELFHLLACKIFKLKIIKFTILPLGVSMAVKDIEKVDSIKQVIIYLMGPISVFINVLIANILFSYNLISIISFNNIISLSVAMSLCNLLPIFPLDGYKALKSMLQIFIPYKKALKVSNIISLIAFTSFIFINFISFQLTITLFLCFEQIKNLKNYKMIYKRFLIYKTMNKKKKKFKMINDYQMFKDVNNYQIEKNKILDDYDIATIELKKYI